MTLKHVRYVHGQICAIVKRLWRLTPPPPCVALAAPPPSLRATLSDGLTSRPTPPTPPTTESHATAPNAVQSYSFVPCYAAALLLGGGNPPRPSATLINSYSRTRTRPTYSPATPDVRWFATPYPLHTHCTASHRCNRPVLLILRSRS
jgi:hypothetical protein